MQQEMESGQVQWSVHPSCLSSLRQRRTLRTPLHPSWRPAVMAPRREGAPGWVWGRPPGHTPAPSTAADTTNTATCCCWAVPQSSPLWGWDKTSCIWDACRWMEGGSCSLCGSVANQWPLHSNHNASMYIRMYLCISVRYLCFNSVLCR